MLISRLKGLSRGPMSRRGSLPFHILDAPHNHAEIAAAKKRENLSHKGQERALEGRAVLAACLEKHGGGYIELTGSFATSSDDAIANAIANAIVKASQSLHSLRWFEGIETRGQIEGGRVAHWQVTLKIGFTLEE